MRPESVDGAADVAIVASVTADELRFESQPEVRTRFVGTGEPDSSRVTTRRNVDSPVQPGKTYRRVFAATRLCARLPDGDPDVASGV
jgi:hypothetical protein